MTNAQSQPHGVNNWSLWFGIFGGLVAWALFFVVGYIIAYGGCELGFASYQRWLLIVAGVAAVISIAATVIAYRQLQCVGMDEEDTSGEATEEVLGRSRLMAVLGTWLSGLSLFIIVMVSIAAIWMNPCA